MLSINHTSTASIRLSILRTHCQTEKKILYITDNSEDILLMRSFARELTGSDWKEIQSLPLLWHAIKISEGFFFISVDMFHSAGNLTHLERQSSLLIRRNETLTEESCIESLISLGYTHGDARDTP